MTPIWNQIYATFCINIGVFSFSLAYGWPSPSGLLLQSDQSPLDTGPCTSKQFATIVSLLSFGSGTTLIIFGWISDRFGKKLTFLLAGPIVTLSWIMIAIGTNVNYLYAARILVGIASGTFGILGPVFIAEIADDHIRGLLLASHCVITNVGTVVSFIAGEYLDYYHQPYIGIISSAIFLILIVFVPESPQFLYTRKRLDEAKKSLKFYKGELLNVAEEERELTQPEKMSLSKNESKEKLHLSDLFTRESMRSFLYCFILYQGSGWSGIFMMINFSSSIFKESGSNLPPNINSIIVGAILLSASFTSFIFIEKLGRKILIIISTCGTGTMYTVLGLYFYFKHLGYDISAVNWIPLMCLSSIMFLASLGIISVAYAMTIEILPPKVRNLFSCILYILLCLSVFVLNFNFQSMIEVFNFHNVLWFFGSCCFFEMGFVAIFLPETKGKSFEEIARAMNR